MIGSIYGRTHAAVAMALQVPPSILHGRSAAAVLVRHLAMTACVEAGLAASDVGRQAGMDHSTVLNAVKVTRRRIDCGDEVAARALEGAREMARGLIDTGARGIPAPMSALLPLKDLAGTPPTNEAVPTGKPANASYNDNPRPFVPRTLSFWAQWTKDDGTVVAGGSCKVSWYSITLTDKGWVALLLEEVTMTAGTLYTKTYTAPGNLYPRMHTFTAPGGLETRIKLYAQVV